MTRGRRRNYSARKMAHEAAAQTLQIQAPTDELLAVHEALGGLTAVDAVAAELVKLRYFVGMTLPEAAERLELSQRLAERLRTFSRAWLRDALRRTA